jgi:phosphate transport system substrate-binding protein
VKRFLEQAIAGALFVVSVGPCASLRGQVTSLSQVKTIYVDSFSGDPKDAFVLRNSLIRRLSKDGHFVLVPTPKGADAIVIGTGEIWRRGFISINPRTPSNDRQAVYSGYLSLEVVSADRQPLWSWLATPGKLIWTNFVDDLAGRAAEKLIAAAKSAPSTDIANSSATTNLHTTLTGAGATFPAPLYKKWFEDFNESHPGTKVLYSPVGSQLGIESLNAGKLDFAGSDVVPEQLNGVSGAANLRRFAMVLGAVVPIYNLKGGIEDLHFTPEALADIYLGKVRRWDDPEIRRSNKGANLPNEDIVVIHRSDGSGTTWVWSDFLSKVSPVWSSTVGRGTTIKWPVGTGAERNDGIAEAVGRTPYAIGYVELSYAIQRDLSFGSVRNRAGEYIHADLESLSEAARMSDVTGELAPSITNSQGKGAYPIAAFTWILIPEENSNQDKRDALIELLRWALTSGQKECSALGYVPLPQRLAEDQLHRLSVAVHGP